MQIGDKVWFGRKKGQQTQGTIVECLQRNSMPTFKIRQDEERGRYPVGTIWTVPESLCREASAVTSPVTGRTLTTAFKVGDRVRFGRQNGEKTLGIIMKVNGRTVKVRQEEARGQHPVGLIWNVAPTLCELV